LGIIIHLGNGVDILAAIQVVRSELKDAAEILSSSDQTIAYKTAGFFVFLSVVLAYFKPATIVAILGVSWGAVGSAFLGPFFWGLITNRVTRVGAVSSSILGLGTCLGLYLAGWPSPQAGTLGMIVSLAINPMVSFLRHKQLGIFKNPKL